VGFGSLDTNERKPSSRKFGWTQQLSYSAVMLPTTTTPYSGGDKRFTRGYQFLAHYTWSKALGYDSDYYAIDPKLNYGVDYTDREHVFV